jgi:hypothetical protein
LSFRLSLRLFYNFPSVSNFYFTSQYHKFPLSLTQQQQLTPPPPPPPPPPTAARRRRHPKHEKRKKKH